MSHLFLNYDRRSLVSHVIDRGAATDRNGLAESDSDLLERCRRGDDAAWRTLVSTYTRRVFALSYRFTGRLDEAEDLTQEIFVKVYENLGRFGDGSFPAWLMTLARNHAIDHYRSRREDVALDAGLFESLASPQEGPFHRLAREERKSLVHRGLRSLPPELRQPLILCDLEGLAYDEVATIMNLPLGTVKSRINRGRIELAKRLLARFPQEPGNA